MSIADLIRLREIRSSREQPRKFISEYGGSTHSLNTLSHVGDLQGHEGCVNTINFNRQGNLLVSGSDDRQVCIWDWATGTCLTSLRGHSSNVFTATFLPHKADKEVISGSNDSDIRHYDLIGGVCTTFCHHTRKVLRLSVNPLMPDSFLSCSTDGTVRMFDVRVKYENTFQSEITQGPSEDEEVLPQAFGGGRASARAGTGGPSSHRDSLLLNFNEDAGKYRRVMGGTRTLFSVDMHPFDGHSFIVGSQDGKVRLFDLRMLRDHSSSSSYVNIYGNPRTCDGAPNEITGCVFSRDGTEIVGSYLNDFIYVWDVSMNFEKEFGIDYFPGGSKKNTKKKRDNNNKKQKGKKGKSKKRKAAEDDNNNNNEKKGKEKEMKTEENKDEKEDNDTEEREEERGGRNITLRLDQLDLDFFVNFMTNQAGRSDILREYAAYRMAKNNEEENEYNSDEDVYDDSEGEEEDEQGSKEEVQTYKQVYKGHKSSSTIKAANFYGPNSEYVISGSDDAQIFIWDKKTGKLLRMLEGHARVVNCVEPHPFDPVIVTSGMDIVIKLWGSLGAYPAADKLAHRQRRMEKTAKFNTEALRQEEEREGINFCSQQ